MGAIDRPERFLRAASGQPWAILPSKAQEIIEFLSLRAQGHRPSAEHLATITAARRRGENLRTGGGVAVIPMFGVIAQRASGFRESSGAMSLERFSSQFDEAVASDEIDTIVLHVSSPGGSVDGVMETAERIYEARAKKRIIAVCDPLMASAAYWIGSAAHEIAVTPSGRIGSIGVIAYHFDWSEYEKDRGLTTTVFTAGRFKGEGNPHEPLTAEAKEYMQETLDDYYSRFLGAVAKHRGVSEEDVRGGFGEGRVVTAERAVAEGLADRVATMDQVLEELGVRRRSSGVSANEESVEVEAIEPLGVVPDSLSGTAKEDTDIEVDADGAAPAGGIESPDNTGPRAQEDLMGAETAAGPQVDTGALKEQERAATLAAERKRVQLINDTCALHEDLVSAEQRQAWINEGASVESVQEAIVHFAREKAKPIIATQPDTEAAAAAAIKRRSRSQDDEPGMAFGRFCRAFAAGDGRKADAIAWADEVGYTDISAAMQSSDFAAGGALVPENYIPEVIELLRPASAVRSLNPTFWPMTGGNASVPKLTGGATAYYKGEAQRGTKSEATTGRVNLVAKDLMTFIPITSQLLRRSSPNADMVVRDDSISALAQRSDLAFIRGAGTEYSPKGLRYQAVSGNIIAANGTVNLANVTTDLGKLVLALEDADVRMIRPGWIFAPRTKHYLMTVRDGNGNYAFREEMLAGMLWGYPYAVTSQIPNNLGGGSDESEVYFADFADVVIGEEENLRIDIFRQATYWDGSAWQSAAQNDEVILRLIAAHDLGMRHDESVAVLTGVTWGA